MTVLRFSFSNHSSFRDEATLTFVQPRLKTTRPVGGAWDEYVFKVAAIYGANAAGKTGVLDALRYMRHAIDSSATSWSIRDSIPRRPFRLDEHSRNASSRFELDFVIDETRHTYGFEISQGAVLEEWLLDYPSSRRRLLFERQGDDVEFGRALTGVAMIAKGLGARELLLSRAALLRHPLLAEVSAHLLAGIQITRFGDNDRRERLASIMSDVLDGDFSLEDIRLLLKIADVGIVGAEIEEKDAPPEVERIFRLLMSPGDSEQVSESSDQARIQETLRVANRRIKFEHVGENDDLFELSMDSQSSGTLTWLSLAAPAVKALRAGALYAVDEIDASLHPQLALVLVGMFRDPAVNTSGAQLIFTTHDTFFLSPVSGLDLSPDEVWLVEKGRDGRSELFSLGEFPVRSDHNVSRRYLQGRYGAVPAVAPSFIASLVSGEGSRSDGEEK